MIGSLRGTLLDRGETAAVVEVAGLGYRVAATPGTLASLGQVGDEVFLWVHHHRREDAELLFGFADRDELDVFEILIATHGVGPSLALAVLAVHRPRALRLAIATDDVSALCLVPGIGRKTAARLMVELGPRLGGPDVDLTDRPVSGAAGAAHPHADIREALAGLGYGLEEISLVLRDLPTEGDSAELLRAALQRLAAA